MSGICPGITQSGLKCSAKPPTGKVYCIWHDPDRAALKAFSAKGGRNKRSEVRAAKVLAAGYASLGDINDVLRLAMYKVESGKMDPKVANSLATLAGRIQALTLGSEIESRLSELLKDSGEITTRITQLRERTN